MRKTVCCLAVVLVILVGCKGAETQKQEAREEVPQKAERKAPTLTVTSSAFEPGAQIPKTYTGEGDDISPPLSWTGAPEGTKEFALICDDPDAPRREPWVHWVIYKIPGDRNYLPEGSAAGAVEGKNSSGHTGYGGPMPPPGHGVHHYQFKIYALGQPLDLQPGASKAQLLKAMEGHVLAKGGLVGTYER